MINGILQNKRILFIGAHPDDFEDYFGGTFLSLFEQNIVSPTDVFFLICTDGSKGSRSTSISADDLKNVRIKEQQDSLNFLGIPQENYFQLHNEDGYLHNNDNELIEQIVYHIRKLKPDILLTHNGLETLIPKSDGFYHIHKDHRTIGQAVLDAAYPYSRDLLFFPQHHEEGLQGHTVKEILFAETSSPNVIVDISSYMDKKKELMKVFASQIDSDEDLNSYLDMMCKDGNSYKEYFQYINLVV